MPQSTAVQYAASPTTPLTDADPEPSSEDDDPEDALDDRWRVPPPSALTAHSLAMSSFEDLTDLADTLNVKGYGRNPELRLYLNLVTYGSALPGEMPQFRHPIPGMTMCVVLSIYVRDAVACSHWLTWTIYIGASRLCHHYTRCWLDLLLSSYRGDFLPWLM